MAKLKTFELVELYNTLSVIKKSHWKEAELNDTEVDQLGELRRVTVKLYQERHLALQKLTESYNRKVPLKEMEKHNNKQVVIKNSLNFIPRAKVREMFDDLQYMAWGLEYLGKKL